MVTDYKTLLRGSLGNAEKYWGADTLVWRGTSRLFLFLGKIAMVMTLGSLMFN